MKTEMQKQATKRWRDANKNRVREYMAAWRKKNSERVSEYDKEYKQSHKSQSAKAFKAWRESKGESFLKAKRQYQLQRYKNGFVWKPKTEDQVNRIRAWSKAYQKKKRAAEPEFKMLQNLRSRLNGEIRKPKPSGNSSMTKLIGCTLPELRAHIENQFDGKMSWENYGSYWHIDHIKECFWFNMLDDDDARKCFHFSNLRPLEKSKNISRSCLVWMVKKPSDVEEI